MKDFCRLFLEYSPGRRVPNSALPLLGLCIWERLCICTSMFFSIYTAASISLVCRFLWWKTPPLRLRFSDLTEYIKYAMWSFMSHMVLLTCLRLYLANPCVLPRIMSSCTRAKPAPRFCASLPVWLTYSHSSSQYGLNSRYTIFSPFCITFDAV